MSDIVSQLPVADKADGAPGSAAPTSAIQVAGSDGTNLRTVSTDTTGKLNVNNISGTVSLPTGAATSAQQTTANTSVATIETKTPALGQALAASSVPVVLTAAQLTTLTPLSSVSVSNFPATQPISATSLPLPTGAATSALQTTGNTSLASIDTKTPTVGQKTMANSRPVVIASDQSAVLIQGGNSTAVKVDGSAVTQPISAASLPLPTGAATSALQTTGNTTLTTIDTDIKASQPRKLQDGSGNAITSTTISTKQALDVNVANSVTINNVPSSGAGFAWGQVFTAGAGFFALIETPTYTEQTVNAQRSLSSSNSNDIAGGTGARTVKITYLDQTGAGPFTETVALNGTNTANTVASNICFIESLIVTTAGNLNSNQGTITLFAAANKAGAQVATIAVNANSTQWAHHYVPTGKTSYITSFSFNNNASTAANGATFILKSSGIPAANTISIQISDFNHLAGLASNTVTRVYASPIQVVGPARITAWVNPDSATSTSQNASFDYFDA